MSACRPKLPTHLCEEGYGSVNHFISELPIAAAVPHLQRKRHVDDLVPSLRGFRRRIRELREKASHATLEGDPPTEQALFTETLITRSSNPRVSPHSEKPTIN